MKQSRHPPAMRRAAFIQSKGTVRHSMKQLIPEWKLTRFDSAELIEIEVPDEPRRERPGSTSKAFRRLARMAGAIAWIAAGSRWVLSLARHH